MCKEYTVREVSDILKMYPETISRFIREGIIEAEKRSGKWVISEDHLKSFVDNYDDQYGPAYRAYHKHLEFERLKDTDPQKYYRMRLKGVLNEIEMMHAVLDRYYMKIQKILEEETRGL